MYRPKVGETVEDILKLEKEFFKNKEKPAVFILNKSNMKSEATTSANTSSNVDENNLTANQPILLGNIIERKITAPVLSQDVPRFLGGFPQAKRRQHSTETRKGSIFSQQNKRLKNKEESTTEKMEIDNIEGKLIDENKRILEAEKNLPAHSYIISGEDSEDIHRSNIEKLNKMKHEEIVAEQKQLLNTLDPDIVKFLKSVRKRDDIAKGNSEISEKKTIMEPVTEINEIETPKEIIECSNTWLHFDQIETEKLQWMKSIELPKTLKSDEPYEARFDFNGWLLPYTNPEISEANRSLYHHGEEPGRPGYTLKELFKLCRSNVHQQRILALNTISNILTLNATGLYEGIIDVPLEQIFFIVRISVDDNRPAQVAASIKAIHSLFVNKIDEACLDAMCGYGCFIQPILAVQQDKQDEKELNDQQVAELDLIKCLMRTDILIRIRYILSKVRPSSETVIYCLEVLTRLLRDSYQITTQVCNCEDLFSIIIKQFVPVCTKIDEESYEKPMAAAVKLLRIAASRSKRIADELITKFDIFKSIVSYLWNAPMKHQIETLRLLAVLLHYQLGLEYIRELQPCFVRLLHYHLHSTNIDEKSKYLQHNHFAALINTISQISLINAQFGENILLILEECFAKFASQIANLKNFECGKLQNASSLIVCVTNILKGTSNKSDIDRNIHKLIKSEGFNIITNNISTGSNLLCEYEPYKCSANLKTAESVIWKTSEHIVPCLHRKSSVPFLAALSCYLEVASDKLKMDFIQHPNIKNYLNQLQDIKRLHLTSNWFTKCETILISNILKTSVALQEQVTELDYYFSLCVKCLTIFRHEQKPDIDFFLKNIIFNSEFYPNEIRLANIALEAKNDILQNVLNDLDEIYLCYAQVFLLQKNTLFFTSSLSLDIQLGSLIPLDWVFYPIINAYAKQQETKEDLEEKQQTLFLTKCLQWIFLYESHLPQLANIIDPTDRFCRLACVFLCSNTLFLESDVRTLLEACLKILLKDENYRRINFDKEIQGLNNFQDFYTQLLEQFQGVSYGDSVFANYILVPLAQKHNIKWRKMLWSEYLGVCQSIRLTPEECFLKKEEFLNPLENDLSLLECYDLALGRKLLKRSVLLKQVAYHHIKKYRQNNLRNAF